MRTIDECSAEIFRRSKLKIQKQKRNKRILLCCTPLLLCVCSLVAWKAFPGETTDGGVTEVGGTIERGSASTALHYFEIKTDTASYQIADEATVNLILNILDNTDSTDDITAPTEEIAPPAHSTIYGTGNLKGNTDTEYQLTYYSKSGQCQTYTVIGATVINCANGNACILTPSERLQLFHALESGEE